MVFEIVSVVVGLACFKYALSLIELDQREMEKYELKKL